MHILKFSNKLLLVILAPYKLDVSVLCFHACMHATANDKSHFSTHGLDQFLTPAPKKICVIVNKQKGTNRLRNCKQLLEQKAKQKTFDHEEKNVRQNKDIFHIVSMDKHVSMLT